MNTRHQHEQGVSMLLIMVILLSATTIIFGGLSIWAYTQYTAANTDVNGKVQLAVTQAKHEQQTADQKEFDEKEKEPLKEFVGPDDYGRVTFSYPKTWSVYVATDPSRGGTYEAYFHPKEVPFVAPDQQFALRVKIEKRSAAQVIDSYKSKVDSGDLRSSTTVSQGFEGTRFTGNFNNKIRGSAVVFKVDDKALTISTDANTFMPDFENIILKTIKLKQ